MRLMTSVLLLVPLFWWAVTPLQAAEGAWGREELRPLVLGVNSLPEITPETAFSRLGTYRDYASERGWKKLEVLVYSEMANTHMQLQQLNEAEALVEQYLGEAERLGATQARLSLLGVQLNIYDTRADQNNAIRLRKRYETAALTAGDQRAIGQMYADIGLSHSLFGETRQALLSLEKALAIFERIDNPLGKGGVLNSIAILHNDTDDPAQAVEYYRRAEKIYQAEGDQFSLSVIYFNLGQTYFKLKDLEMSSQMLNTALAMSRSIKDEIGVAYAHRYLGKVADANGHYALAEQHFGDGLAIFERFDDPRMIFLSSIGLTQVLRSMGRLDEATARLEGMEALALSLQRDNFLIDYYQQRYQLEKSVGNAVDALAALETLHELQRAKHDKEKQESVQALMVEFDSNRKEAENRLLLQQNELKQLRLTEQESQQIILLLGFGLVMLMGGLVSVLLYKQIQHRNRFKLMALRDELTGAPNRRAIMARARKKFDECRQQGSMLTIAMLDIDNFKAFNDNYGHHLGDEVLIVFGEACRQTLRGQDLFGRYGGEEWILVLEEAHEAHIDNIFLRLSNYLKTASIKGSPGHLDITFSLGAAQLRDSDTDLEMLIKRADDNLYRAKREGKNRYVIGDDKRVLAVP